MTAVPSRRPGLARPAAPVRLLHLGLGNFFRAHQAWYTDRSPDAADWGIAAVEGRSARVSQALRPQDGVYTLVTRAAEGNRFDLVSSLARVHGGQDHDAWLSEMASPQVAAVTVTVTEAGYVRGPDGGLDHDRDVVRADVDALRGDLRSVVRTAPARLVAGLAARRSSGAGPLALVPCDNLPGNGEVARRVVRELAEMVDAGLAEWIDGTVSWVSTMVDRITPRTAPEDLEAVARATGLSDAAPVVTEPFAEWVLSGDFPAGRPRWDAAGARFTADVTPFEDRKLWLLNGGHSLLAYAGSIRGATTVAEAVGDETVRGWLEQWWAEASPYVALPEADLRTYRAALLERFANPRIRHLLGQIAADGSQKLPVRVLPTLRRERAAGRIPQGATLLLAAWVCHLRGHGTAVADVRGDELAPLAEGPLPPAVRRVLAELDPELATDREVVSAVVQHADRLERLPQPSRS